MSIGLFRIDVRILAHVCNLNVDFVSPIPLGVEVEVEAWVTRVEGRKSSGKGRMVLAAGGKILAEATSLFVVVPEFFEGRREGS